MSDTLETNLAGSGMQPQSRDGPKSPVPLTIITGFLGSGKTTVLNNLLHNKLHLRIAVVVNEFGSINIDGEIVESAMLGGTSAGGQGGAGSDLAPMEMLFLSNGCVCCSASTDLQTSLAALLKRAGRNIDCVVLETSGVTDPVPLVDALMLPSLQELVSLHNVVTVVDSEVLGMLEPGSETLASYLRQLSVADLVLLNKADLVTGVQLRKAEANIQAIIRQGRAAAAAEMATSPTSPKSSAKSRVEPSPAAANGHAPSSTCLLSPNYAPPPVISCRFGQVPLAVILGVDQTLDELPDDVVEPKGAYPAMGTPAPGRVWRTASNTSGDAAEVAAQEWSDDAQVLVEGVANGQQYGGHGAGDDCRLQHDGAGHGSCCGHGEGGSDCGHAACAGGGHVGASVQGKTGRGVRGRRGSNVGGLTYTSSKSGTHCEIMSISISCRSCFAVSRLQQFFLQHVTPQVLRIKGFFLLDAPGTRRYLIQMAGRRRFTFKEDDWPRGTLPATKFVILGINLDVPHIVKCLRGCLADVPAPPLYRAPVSEAERLSSWEHLSACVVKDGRFDADVKPLGEDGALTAEEDVPSATPPPGEQGSALEHEPTGACPATCGGSGGGHQRFLFRLLGSKFHELPSDTVNTMLLSQINTGGRIFVSQACSAAGDVCVRLDISCMLHEEVRAAWREVENNASTVLSKLFFEIFCCSPFA